MRYAQLVFWLQTAPDWHAGGYPEDFAWLALDTLQSNLEPHRQELAIVYLKHAEHGLRAVACLHEQHGRYEHARAAVAQARNARKGWRWLRQQGGMFPPPLDERLTDTEPHFSAEGEPGGRATMTLPEITSELKQALDCLCDNDGASANELSHSLDEAEAIVMGVLEENRRAGFASNRIARLGEELDEANARIAELEEELAKLREQLENAQS